MKSQKTEFMPHENLEPETMKVTVEWMRGEVLGTGTGIRTPVPWLRTTCPDP